MKVQLTKNKELFNYCKPYVIAELGSNHNGNMDLAKKLIIQAKEAGADMYMTKPFSPRLLLSNISKLLKN